MLKLLKKEDRKITSVETVVLAIVIVAAILIFKR